MIAFEWNADPTLPALHPVTKTVSSRELAKRTREGRPRVDIPLLLHAIRAVLDDPGAGVHVAGARRDVDGRIVAERVLRGFELEDAAPTPPWKKTRSLLGSPFRIQKAYRPPRAHRVA